MRRCEDCIFNAAGGIGGEPGTLFRIEAGDALDKPNGADGDKILLITALGVVFFHDMGHQAQIVADQGIPGLRITLGVFLQVLSFLSGGQGAGKRSPAGQAQGKQKRIDQQQHSRQHGDPS
jgi:hypothetical protein